MSAALPPVMVELKANASQFLASMAGAEKAVQKLGTESASHLQKFSAVGKAALFGLAGAAARR